MFESFLPVRTHMNVNAPRAWNTVPSILRSCAELFGRQSVRHKDLVIAPATLFLNLKSCHDSATRLTPLLALPDLEQRFLDHKCSDRILDMHQYPLAIHAHILTPWALSPQIPTWTCFLHRIVSRNTTWSLKKKSDNWVHIAETVSKKHLSPFSGLPSPQFAQVDETEHNILELFNLLKRANDALDSGKNSWYC